MIVNHLALRFVRLMLVGFLVASRPVRADDWPQWRGPLRDGVWREDGILEQFPPAGPPVRWRTPIGAGFTGPAVAGGRVFLMDRTVDDGAPTDVKTQWNYRDKTSGQERVLCLDEATGRILWKHTYPCLYETAYGCGPRATPTVSGDRVYTVGAMGDLICLDAAAGQVVWQKNFVRDYGAEVPLYGFASAPLVDGDRLIVMVGGEGQTVMALDRHTGRALWKSSTASEPGYCAPVICTISGVRQLVVWHADGLMGLEPESGKELWSVRHPVTAGIAIVSPAIEGRRLAVASQYEGVLMLEFPAGAAEPQVLWDASAGTVPERQWKKRGFNTTMSTVLLLDGYLYGVSLYGETCCLNADNGERVWTTLQPTSGGTEPRERWSTLFMVPHGDNVFIWNDHGDLILARLTAAGYQELSRAHILDPDMASAGSDGRRVAWSHPAFANRCCYVRNNQEIVCVSLAAPSGEERVADQLAAQIDTHVRHAVPPAGSPGQSPSVVQYESLAVAESWTEIWPDADGQETTRSVHGRIWNAAIQAALAAHHAVFLPPIDSPYYLDEPIVLQSGQRLSADPRAEIRLRPGVNTCMVRNAHLVASQDGPVPADVKPDTQIAVEGGIWTTLATSPTQSNGNVSGRSARQGEVPSCHGVLLFNNLHGLLIKDICIRQSRAHGVQLSNCRDFLVDGVTFEDHRRDGVHVNGPASYGVIRAVRGVTGDDVVALNAWDWRNTAPSFGPIDHILVQGVHGDPSRAGTDEIRLLPGTKTFAGGKLDCPIADCVLRDLHDIRTVKIYDQPNLELGRDNDFSDPIGTIRNVHFQKLVYNRPGRIQVAVNAEGLSLDDVLLNFDVDQPPYGDFELVEIGPMSQTYEIDPQNPSTWVELFSPDRDVTVRDFRLARVRAKRGNEIVPLADAESQLVRVADQQPNPDYPKTTPRGGTGKARLVQ